MTRRGFASLSLLAFGSSRAQSFPSKPLRLLVGQQIGTGLGQTVIVDNKPGAGTNIAMRALIDSPPDGHTLMRVADAAAANPTLYQSPPFDTLRDLTPISLVGRLPVVIAANAASEVNSIARLVALSKARPGSVNYGTPGNGSTTHLAVELFQRAAGIELTPVPYKGGAQAITDTLAGHIQTVAVNALEVLPHVKAGKLRVLAVLSATRSPIFPDAPSIAESGYPGFEASVWYGFVGPAGLPPAVVARLHAEIQTGAAARARCRGGRAVGRRHSKRLRTPRWHHPAPGPSPPTRASRSSRSACRPCRASPTMRSRGWCPSRPAARPTSERVRWPGRWRVRPASRCWSTTGPWNAIAAPAGTPPAVVERLNRAVREALAGAELRDKLARLGVRLQAGSPAELQALLGREFQRWGAVIRAARIEPE